MSAYIVSDECMHKVVGGLAFAGLYSHVIRIFAEENPHTREGRTAIGRKLFAMNEEAIRQRYVGRYENMLSSPLDSLTYEAPDVGHVPTTRDALVPCIKAMDCLAYQCNEGNVDETPLYAELEKAAGRLASYILATSAAYEAAPWG